jgi:hypothetical protein
MIATDIDLIKLDQYYHTTGMMVVVSVIPVG